MSKTVDQRVVEMRFDNRQFENNVSTTLSSLDKLKRSLNLEGASKGLENVDKAARRVDMSGLSNGIETVRSGFSALEVMAVTTLVNITNQAVNAGKRIISALTIDPIKTGFQEYETQINAVQTILANTSHQGTSLEQVNAALDELNHYADMTIYNFTEMTRNIGTFTAAGVNLKDSTQAIKGIANLAAVSGSTSQQASTAMYQLSQALAAGVVNLQDWNSVVNAGMGGKVFQDALMQTAEAMGIVVDRSQSFRESISTQSGTGWLTSEVLLNTLKQFTGDMTEAELAAMGFTKAQIESIQAMAVTANDAATKVKTFTQLWDTLKEAAQSGWTQTWEIIVGDFEEAKEFLTDLSNTFNDVIGKSAESRNALLYDGLTSNWKKLNDEINNAGISTEDFKNKITEVAKKHKVDVDAIVKEYGSLEKAFKNGAISSGFLTEALGELTGSSADISKKMEELTGKFKTNNDIIKALTDAGYKYNDIQNLTEKASRKEKIALTDLTDAQLMHIGYTDDQVKSIRDLAKQADIAGGSVNNLIKNIAVPSGRELLIDALRISIDSLIDILGTVGDAWRQVFPPMTADQLYSITKAINDFAAAIKPSEETLDKLTRTFRGLFSILGILKQAIVAVAKALAPLLSGMGGFADGILSATANIGDWIYNLNKSIETTNIFGEVLQRISAVIIAVVDVAKRLFNAFKEKFVIPGLEVFNAFLENFRERLTQVDDAVLHMENGVVLAIRAMGDALLNSNFLQLLSTIWKGVLAIGRGLAEAFGILAGGLVEKIGNADFSNILDLINTLIAGGIGLAIKKFVDGASDAFSGFEGVVENITGILDGVRGSIEAYQTQLKAGTLLKIATAIGILAASLVVLSLVDSGKLAGATAAITVLFGDLVASMALLGGIQGNLLGAAKSISVMTGLSIAVFILATALKKIADLNFEQLTVGLLGVITLTATMISAVKLMGSGGTKAIKGATQMVIFAAAVKVLASACKDLSVLNWEELAKGLVGVGVLLTAVSIFVNNTKFSGKTILTATGIVILSGAMLILASAVKDFSSMSWEEIGKGLAAVGGLLAEITLFTNLSGNAKHVISTAISLTIIGAAMKIFASSLQDFSKLSWDEIGRGLVAMASALYSVAFALNLMPKNMIGIGTGLVIVSAALLIMNSAVSKMAQLTWDEIGRGLLTLGGSMLILAAALNLMKGTLAGSAALLIATTSLAILAPVLKLLGGMSWEAIARGLVAIAGAFTVLGLAGIILGPMVPIILSLAGSFALIGAATVLTGAGLLAIGAGLSAAAVGFAAFVTSISAGAASIIASLAVIIAGLIGLIPVVAEKIGEAIIVLLKVLAEGVPVLGEAFVAIVLTLVDVFVECIPAIAKGILELLDGVLDYLLQYAPKIVDSILEFIIILLEGVANKLPKLIQAAVDVLVAFFSGVIDAIKGIDVNVLVKAIEGVGLMSLIMIALGSIVSLVPSAMAGVIGMGVVIAEITLLLAAIGGLAQIPGLKWIVGEGGEFLELIGNAIGGLIGGMVGGFMSGIIGQFPQIGEDLSSFMENLQPFITGAKSIDASVLDGVKALAETILILTAANVMDSLTSWFTGGSSLSKFAEDLVPFGNAMREFSGTMIGMDGALVANAATAGKALAEMAATIPNSGGLVAFFTGENDMTDFASKLIPFGKAMKDYSIAVSGIDANAVVNSATAGKALVEMASTIPNSGGLVAFFTGDNDLDKFGVKLVAFGASMRAYSIAVSGLDTDTVINSVTAGKALTELANTIPNTGGLISLFTGSNDIDTFGEQLVSFGRNFASYASLMVDVDSGVVTSTSNAAQSLVTLTKSLPENKLFTNETWLDEFGAQLAEFGRYFKVYYDQISSIDTSQLSSVIRELDELVRVARGMTDLDTSAMSSFGRSLTNIGNSGIEGFIKAFTDANYRVVETVSLFLNTFISAITAQKVNLLDAFRLLVSDIMKVFSDKYHQFNLIGAALITQIIAGIQSKEASLYSQVRAMLSGIITTINNYRSRFYDAGRYLAEGFAAGIEDYAYLAIEAAESMARAASRAAEFELDINSPSKVGERIGGFFGLGFVNEIFAYADKAYEAGSDMADAAKKGLSNAVSKVKEFIDGGLDTQPTIRPVLDLTDVEYGTKRINAMFSRTQAQSISTGMRRNSENDNQNGDDENITGKGNVFKFTQNNYSPKALSRVEIYRQTKNQFSALERVVKA